MSNYDEYKGNENKPQRGTGSKNSKSDNITSQTSLATSHLLSTQPLMPDFEELFTKLEAAEQRLNNVTLRVIGTISYIVEGFDKRLMTELKEAYNQGGGHEYKIIIQNYLNEINNVSNFFHLLEKVNPDIYKKLIGEFLLITEIRRLLSRSFNAKVIEPNKIISNIELLGGRLDTFCMKLDVIYKGQYIQDEKGNYMEEIYGYQMIGKTKYIYGRAYGSKEKYYVNPVNGEILAMLDNSGVIGPVDKVISKIENSGFPIDFYEVISNGILYIMDEHNHLLKGNGGKPAFCVNNGFIFEVQDQVEEENKY